MWPTIPKIDNLAKSVDIARRNRELGVLLGRRSFLTGLGAMLAAPAIVHAGNLMPVKALKIAPATEYDMAVILNRVGEEIHRSIGTIREDDAYILSMKKDGNRVEFLRSIVRPWEEPTYGLRDDLLKAFAELDS